MRGCICFPIGTRWTAVSCEIAAPVDREMIRRLRSALCGGSPSTTSTQRTPRHPTSLQGLYVAKEELLTGFQCPWGAARFCIYHDEPAPCILRHAWILPASPCPWCQVQRTPHCRTRGKQRNNGPDCVLLMFDLGLWHAERALCM